MVTTKRVISILDSNVIMMEVFSDIFPMNSLDSSLIIWLTVPAQGHGIVAIIVD